MMTLDGHLGRVRGLAYVPDGSMLASCGDDGTVRLWDRADGRQVESLPGSLAKDGYHLAVYGVAVSPSGGQLACAGGDGKARCWPTRSSRRHGPAVIAARAGVITSVAFVDDRRIVCTGGNGSGQAMLCEFPSTTSGVARLGATGDWRPPSMAPADGAGRPVMPGIWCAAARPGTDLVALGTSGIQADDQGIYFWNPESGTEPYPGPASVRVRSLAFSPDGRSLAATQKHVVVVWDMGSTAVRATLRGHAATVFGVAYAPDNSAMASASLDGTVRLWDAESGAERACYDWGIGRLDCVAFAPDGMTIAAGGVSKVVVWDFEG